MNQDKHSALEYISQRASTALEVSHSIWEYAELSLKEYSSSALYIKLLREEGFEVKEKLCGIDTAFSGSYGKGSPVIGITGEFDALSGLSQKGCSTSRDALQPGGNGHGCGHNMLGAAAFAAALGIKNWLEQTNNPGTIIFYGCPGEEGGASKALLAREDEWKKCDAVLTWHPADVNEVSTGTCNSTVQAIYTFKGVSAHAAGDPEHGRSALDAAELMNIGVQFLREHMSSQARIHYSFLNSGGISPNVVQAEAKLLYMIRSPLVKDVLQLEKRVDDIAAGAALMTGTTVQKIFVDGCSGTIANNVLEKLLYDNMAQIGVPEYSDDEVSFASELKATYPDYHELPGTCSKHGCNLQEVAHLTQNGTKALNDFLMPLYCGENFQAGSTDVGDVCWLTPTAQFNAVAWPAGCPGHSWQNVSCGLSSIGDKAVIFAAKVLCASAIDLMTQPETLKAAKTEFASRTAGGYVCPVPKDAKLYVIEE